MFVELARYTFNLAWLGARAHSLIDMQPSGLERVDKMRIVLVGFMACGKTTVGDLLAKKLNKLQIDLDQAIVEREKLTIPEIFAKFGEDHFRLCEHRALLANIGKDAVITTGGGTPDAGR